MRASVLFEQGKPLEVRELDLEPPRAGEVLVRMVASGVCHSCLHAADGSWAGVPVPIVRESAGVSKRSAHHCAASRVRRGSGLLVCIPGALLCDPSKAVASHR